MTLIYDADGNLLSDGRWTYTWDAENRLIKMEKSAAAAAGDDNIRLKFDHDGRHRRIHKRVYWVGTGYTSEEKFEYDGWNVIAKASGTKEGLDRNELGPLDLEVVARCRPALYTSAWAIAGGHRVPWVRSARATV